MKYFKFTQPYFALVKAENQLHAKELFEETVSPCDEVCEVVEITEQEAQDLIDNVEETEEVKFELEDLSGVILIDKAVL